MGIVKEHLQAVTVITGVEAASMKFRVLVF
jgi:hypothetical protein